MYGEKCGNTYYYPALFMNTWIMLQIADLHYS